MSTQTPPEFNGISSDVLHARLVCLGYIKIGGKAEKQQSAQGNEMQRPVKYDHFRIRTRVRGSDGNYLLDEAIHKQIGAKPTALDVRFRWPTPRENFKSSLIAYDKRKVRCEGDGQRAFDRVLNREIPCTCPLLKQHKGDYPLTSFPRPIGSVTCKPYARLAVMIDAAPFHGGYYVFRTSSWETIGVLTEALNYFQTMFKRIDWIPFKLIVYPHTVTYDQTKTTTAYGVSLVLPGGMNAAYQIAAKANAEREQALALLNAGVSAADQEEQLAALDHEDRADIAAEFHPQSGASEPDYETVTEDEGPNPLEQQIRRALELAKVSPDRINKAFAEFSDRLAELALEVQSKRPDEWKLASEQLEAESGTDAREEANRALDNASLNLFGEP